MAFPQLCLAAFCGLIGASDAAAFTPTFQLQWRLAPSRLHDTSTRRSHLSATKKDSILGADIKYGLDEQKFLEDMDNSLSSLSADSSAATTSSWSYDGHDIFRQIALPEKKRPGAPAVLLVHGFGCSTVYWRETINALTKSGYEVHAIDLLGQGMSAKPTTVEYSINLWAQQVDTYARENLAGEDLVLIGNSVGSLVSLTAATGDFAENATTECYIRNHVVGIGMFNCGIGMNIRNILKDPKWNSAQRHFLSLVFDGLEKFVFGNIDLLNWIMDKVVTRDMLRNVLKELYKRSPDPDAKVDNELVDSFYLPAKHEGSPQVLRQILTNNAGLTPIELHVKHEALLKSLPIHLVWGDEDTVVPLKWQVGEFYSSLSGEENNAVTMDVVHGGHILFDEVPESANLPMISWLNQNITKNVLSTT